MIPSKRIPSSKKDNRSVDELMVERMKLEKESNSSNIFKKMSINSKIKEVDQEIKDAISKS